MRMSQCLPLSFATLAALALPAAAQSQVTISGYLDTGVIPRFASCSIGLQWFRERGLWQDRSYEPRPGDLIFFDWDDEDEGQDGAADHVGIVEKVDGGIVYTVEGNSGDSCRENRYAIGRYEIYGYGTPTY